jgi:metal-responsive CopG/Arc/MetJ family transcriptional regulator
MPEQLIREVEQWARRHDLSRSEAIRRLVKLGLEVKPKWALAFTGDRAVIGLLLARENRTC